ncbi:MAG TPA: glutamate cyclase domain-containing protein [Pirellulales bacterium]|nr:glutamate cyclase domain-containing protein [Pirellulales bacterium]
MAFTSQPLSIFDALEAIVRRDPGRRGVASYRVDGSWLAAGELERAARELAAHAKCVAIVTGFCITSAEPPAAETDGPPGALYLAQAFIALGIETVLLSDRFGLPLLECGRRAWGLEAEIVETPLGAESEKRKAGDAAVDWCHRFFASPLGRRLTHLISIERVGPSHTADSLAAQTRGGPCPLEQFAREVPPEHRGVCHNMRGVSIDAVTAPAHLLFEAAARDASIRTIGIGDGGNEIGMGSLLWETLRAALTGEHAGRTICRIATDHLILSGVSNWGAYALACAVAGLRSRADLLSGWDGAIQRRLIERLVQDAGAVDGVTGRREPTVDGIPLDDYSAIVDQIVRTARRHSIFGPTV